MSDEDRALERLMERTGCGAYLEGAPTAEDAAYDRLLRAADDCRECDGVLDSGCPCQDLIDEVTRDDFRRFFGTGEPLHP